MIPQTIISTVAAVGLLANTADGANPDHVEPVAAAAPSSNVTIAPFDDTRADGTPVWGASATYELSTGDIAEIYLEVDGDEVGEMSIAINGEPITRTRYEGRAPNGPTVTSWTPPVDYSPELLAEVMETATAEDVLHQMIPQAFPCSNYGKKVMKGVKYVWVASVAAFGLACCAGTGGTGCAVCVVGSAVAEEAGSDAIDGYCD